MNDTDTISPTDTLTLGSLNYELNYYCDEECPNSVQLANETVAEYLLNIRSPDDYCYKAERKITLQEAINGADKKLWIQAIEKEYKQQNNLKSFSICMKPTTNEREMDWLLVFKRKYDERGNVSDYKVRATLRGDKQVEDADYYDTYAPVGKLSSLRFFICIVAYMGLQWYQVDYITAFLQSNFDSHRIMHLKFPPLYNIQEAIDALPIDDPIRKIDKKDWKTKLCLRINKSIYGLKQAPKAWFEKLNKSLIELQFTPLQYEPCIFIYTRSENEKYYLFLYVDDTLIAGKDLDFIKYLVSLIQAKHDIKIIGEPKFILGIKLTRCNNGDILMDQNQYIKDIAERFNVTSNPLKLIQMPCTLSQFRKIEDDAGQIDLVDLSLDIRSMVGSLMYVSMGTRADITYFTNYISRYLTKPTKYIVKIIRQTICYLLDTPFIYIKCERDYKFPPQVRTWADASLANNKISRKSTTGGLIKFGRTLIDWLSSKQPVISLSTAESEYVALAEMMKELLYKVALVEEAGIPQSRPLEIFEDNTAAIAISNNPIINKKSKHIDLKYHFIKKHIQDRFAQIKYIATKFQEADILTKVLNSNEMHCLMVARIYNIQWLIDKCESKSRNQTLMIRKMCKVTQPIESREATLQRLVQSQLRFINNSSSFQNQIDIENLRIFVQSCFEEIMSDQHFNINELILYSIAEQNNQLSKAKEHYEVHLPTLFKTEFECPLLDSNISANEFFMSNRDIETRVKLIRDIKMIKEIMEFVPQCPINFEYLFYSQFQSIILQYYPIVLNKKRRNETIGKCFMIRNLVPIDNFSGEYSNYLKADREYNAFIRRTMSHSNPIEEKLQLINAEKILAIKRIIIKYNIKPQKSNYMESISSQQLINNNINNIISDSNNNFNNSNNNNNPSNSNNNNNNNNNNNSSNLNNNNNSSNNNNLNNKIDDINNNEGLLHNNNMGLLHNNNMGLLHNNNMGILHNNNMGVLHNHNEGVLNNNNNNNNNNNSNNNNNVNNNNNIKRNKLSEKSIKLTDEMKFKMLRLIKETHPKLYKKTKKIIINNSIFENNIDVNDDVNDEILLTNNDNNNNKKKKKKGVKAVSDQVMNAEDENNNIQLPLVLFNPENLRRSSRLSTSPINSAVTTPRDANETENKKSKKRKRNN